MSKWSAVLAVTIVASGTFDVKLTPQTPSEAGQASSLGRMSIDKQFQGDLEAASRGEMLMVQSSVKGSAGYVAIERVTGRLGGRSGSFLLQHNGVMERGTGRLTIAVLPDSGTEELTGLTGSMSIDIRDGKHYYRFEYALPAK
jgi:hypothetical protein